MAIGRERPRRKTHGADKMVEELFKSASTPLSTYEARDRLAADGELISVTQIYRIVARLAARGRIRRVETLNAYCAAGGPSDALALCTRCARVTPVPVGRQIREIGEALQASGFDVGDVVVEARGLCTACRDAQGEDRNGG